MAYRLTWLILASVVAAPAMAQTLTVIDPPVTYNNCMPLGVSGDGQVAFGYYQRYTSGDTPFAFRWTRDGGLETLTQSGGYLDSFITSASYDGAVLAGYAYRHSFPFVEPASFHAAMWRSDGAATPSPLVTIGTGPNQWTPGRGGWLVSRDGQVIVGISSFQWVGGQPTYAYFRWRGAANVEPISLPGWITSINQDGTAIIGNRPTSNSMIVYRWREETGVVDLIPSRIATATNSSGTVIAGSGGFRWTLAEGVRTLGSPQGAPYTGLNVEPSAISDDGNVIVGSLGLQTTPLRAFIWTDRIGLWDLNAVLPRMGIVNAPLLQACTGISDNARIVVGTTSIGDSLRGFVLTIPQCSSADFNNDGDAGTDADIEAFFACLAGNCCSTCWWLGADVNGDGDLGTDADIESFFRILAGAAC